MSSSRALFVSLLLSAIFGCSGAIPQRSLNSDPARPVQAQSEARPTSCKPNEPSYQSAVQPLVERYCASCHAPGGDAGDEHDFTQPQVLHAQRRLVSGRLRAHSMPPSTSPQPSEDERATFIRWADCG